MEEKSNNESAPSSPLDQHGQLDLSHPDAIIAEALGLARYADVVKGGSCPLPALDVFGGPADPGVWEAVESYIGNGSRGTLSEREQHFLDLLNLVFSLDGRFGKRNTIRFLTSPHFRFTYQKATEIYSIALELFHANRTLSKDALRAKTADQLEAAYIAAMEKATTARDYRDAAEILKIKAKVLGLDREDPQVLEPAAYSRPFRVFSLDPESIGLPKVDRRELGELIDHIPGISNDDRLRLYRDGGIVDMDIVEILNHESQEAS